LFNHYVLLNVVYCVDRGIPPAPIRTWNPAYAFYIMIIHVLWTSYAHCVRKSGVSHRLTSANASAGQRKPARPISMKLSFISRTFCTPNTLSS